VSYPDGTPTVVVAILGFIESLPQEAPSTIEAALGMLDASVVDD